MAQPPGRPNFPSGDEPWDRGAPGSWAIGPFTEFSSTVTVFSTNAAPPGTTPKVPSSSSSQAKVPSPPQSSSLSSPSQPKTSSPSHSSSSSESFPTRSSSSSHPAPQSTPALQFAGFHSFTTCVKSTIKWSYAGPSSSPMSLNVITAQTSSGWSLVSGLDPMSEEWEWEVTIVGGPYLLQAVVGSDAQLQQFNSEPFSVSNGTDVSCLSTSNLVPTSIAIIPTSSVVASPSPPSTNASHVNSDRHQAKIGAIAGGVIGAIVLLGIMLGILLYYRRRWHRKSSERAIEASPSTVQRGRRILFPVAPFDDHSTPPRSRDVKVKSFDPMMSSQIIAPEYIVSLGATLRPHTDTSEELVTPQDSASQRGDEEQRRSREPSISHFLLEVHDLPSSDAEEANSETNLLPPPFGDSPTLPAPVHHVDSGMRFSTVTPSELAVLDIPPTYTPE